MNIKLVGVGTAVPDGAVSQQDSARLAMAVSSLNERITSRLPAIYEHTTIQRRHSVLVDSASNGHPVKLTFYPTSTGPSDRGPSTGSRMKRYEAEAANLAARAAQSALDSAACPAADIAHLVTVSCSGFSAPGVDIGLINRLHLPRDVSRTNVGFMGCHGALNGLRVAAALAKSNPSSKVLLCCVEICTLHHQYTQQFDHLVANSLFGDGAAAVVVAADVPGKSAWQLLDQRSLVMSDSAERMTWRIGDHGFEMTLSAEVPAILRQSLRAWTEDWLSAQGLEVDDICGWIVHPGGPHILSACSDALRLPSGALDESYGVLAEYGNMSSPTVFFILERLRRATATLPCMMLAFGPGLTIEGALFC